jgi:hypothetical protein
MATTSSMPGRSSGSAWSGGCEAAGPSAVEAGASLERTEAGNAQLVETEMLPEKANVTSIAQASGGRMPQILTS